NLRPADAAGFGHIVDIGRVLTFVADRNRPLPGLLSLGVGRFKQALELALQLVAANHQRIVVDKQGPESWHKVGDAHYAQGTYAPAKVKYPIAKSAIDDIAKLHNQGGIPLLQKLHCHQSVSSVE